MEILIKKKFAHLSAFLVGYPKQFLVVAGSHYCVRESCDECPYRDKGCESQSENISTALIPPARRAVGLEEKPFLVLSLLEGKEFRLPEAGEENPNLVPVSIWNHPRDVYSRDERNLHFILSDIQKPFRVMKGQFRYYGTESEFANSEYAKYFGVYDRYVPAHHIVAIDFSAIEPRGSAIASQEPLWKQIYDGEPKEIVRKIELCEIPSPLPPYLYKEDKDLFCLLMGELDKVSYERQCANCKTPCKVIRGFKKNIPGDFHAINAKAFFSGEPDWPNIPPGGVPTPEQKEILGKYRNISKVCGLASVYGASAWTLAHNMGCSETEAQKRLDNFFALLSMAKRHMLLTEQNILRTGKSRNFFGRIWDLSKKIHSTMPTEKERRREVAAAVRIAYNHPIQSSMAEALKIAMIRADKFITEQKWSPLYGIVVPKLCTFSYTDFICTTLLSIHDECDYLLRSDSFDTVIPPLYQVLQIRDIIKSLGVDFLLEMDVEYDSTRSFTATTKYPGSKVYLLNEVINSSLNSVNPNILLIDIKDISRKKVVTLFNNKEYNNSGEEIEVGVRAGDTVYYCKVPADMIKGIGARSFKAYLAK